MNVKHAIDILQERLKPARLNQTHSNNSALFIMWLNQQPQLLTNGTDEQVADYLYNKIAANLKSELVWDVEPAKAKRERLASANVAIAEKPLDRVTLGKDVEQRNAYAELQKKSEERIHNLIDSFSPASKRGGVDFAAKAVVQDALRKHLAAEKARGVNLADVFPKMQQFVEEKYREIQSRIEKL